MCNTFIPSTVIVEKSCVFVTYNIFSIIYLGNYRNLLSCSSVVVALKTRNKLFGLIIDNLY